MNLIRTQLKKSFIITIAIVQLLGFSVVSLPTQRAAAQTAPTCPAVNGTQTPTGAAAHTYTFKPAGSPDPECVWENAYYIWSPATKVYSPKYDTHVCDPTTNVCENINWVFITSDNQYVERRTVVSAPPSSGLAGSTGTSPTSGSAQLAGDGNGAESQSTGSSIVSGNGTNSDNTITNNSNTNANIDLTNNASVLTTLDSNAASGNAAALFNTTVGNVGTGDATAIANILNMIQSSWNPANGNLNLFSADLYNNYFGDLLFDPSIALGNGTGSTNTVTDNNDQNLTLNVANNANIQNDINLDTTSGNSTANGNTTVGDVSTGDANTVANVINMINSMITAGNSFIGSINLHGDLNGDILLPTNLLEILLGNGSGSGNTITGNNTTDVDADVDTNSTITNNTNLTANSGDAEANNNTEVGNTGTGNAETNVNQMNLIGQNTQGSHGLLVFVNVLGSWVGMLFGGQGNTAISAGNGTNSTNNITDNSNTDVDLDVENNYGITNNLNLNSTSGNATANANTTVGNVSTGNATSSANILNMIDSTMNFTDWFGVLFINVFGDWQGSFGTDTANGEQPTGGLGGGSPAQTQTNTGGGTVAAASTGGVQRFFGFIARSGSNGSGNEAAAENPTQAQIGQTATTTEATPESQIPTVTVGNVPRASSTIWWIAGVAGLISLLLLGGERLLLLIRKP